MPQLIKSTSKTERSYIKKYLGRFSSKEMTLTAKLFDLYIKKDIVEDEKFRIKLGVTSPIFANYKFQLYKLILQALAEFTKNQSVQSQILSYLTQIEVLYNKSLFRDALLLIKKAKNLATQHQEFRLIPQIIQWQIIVMQYISAAEKEFTAEKDLLLDQSISYLDIQKNIIEYQQLKKDYQSIRSNFKDDQIQLINESAKLLDHPIMQSDDQPLSSLARLHYHQLKYLIYLKIDLEKAHKNAHKMLSTLENLGKDYIHNNLSQYVDAHFNILVSASEMKNQEGFIDALNKIGELESNYQKTLNEETAVHIFRSKHLLLAEHFYWFNATDLVINAIGEIKEGMLKYQGKIRTLIITQIYFGIGNAFFNKKEYDRAIGWYTKALDYPKDEMFETTFIKAHIMNLICYHETNYIHLTHIIENTKKSLSKYISNDSFENQTIKFINKDKNSIRLKSNDWPYLLWG